MTAEERLAYFQGEKYRNRDYRTKKSEKNVDIILLKVRFFISVILFIVFLSLDYTDYHINGIGSERIIHEVIKDFDFAQIKLAVDL